MKFTSKMAALLASMMMLNACSSTSSNGVIASVNTDQEITASEVYTELVKSSSGKSTIFQYLIKEIVENNFPVTDAMKTEADLSVENIQTQYETYYGSQAETYLLNALQQSGFADIDDYRNTLIYSLQLKEFLGQYVQEHFDEVFEDYYSTKNPRYVSHVLIMMEDPDNPTEEEQEKLDEVQKLIDSGKDFAEIAKEYSDDSTASVGGELGICDEDTNFDSEFKKVALALDEGEISEATKSDYGYHFIVVTSRDKEKMKNDTQVTEELLYSYDENMIYKALQSYELTFQDAEIEEIYNSQLQSVLKEEE